ncbi:MAG TPA: gas vesicle protein [Pyrinomonadaceae bacterium]|nr:gas vesicle protein [Pyrinomonadaceae bacterium]
MIDEEFAFDQDEELSLLETLDHVLDRGLVIAGEVTIAVADIDLIYVGLNVLLGSVETVNEVVGGRERRLAALRGRAVEAAGEEGAGGS